MSTEDADESMSCHVDEDATTGEEELPRAWQRHTHVLHDWRGNWRAREGQVVLQLFVIQG